MEKIQRSGQHHPPSFNELSCAANSLSTRSPPWSLKGEAWWMVLSILPLLGPVRDRVVGRLRSRQKSKESSKDFESACLNASEKQASRQAVNPAGSFRGGFGSVQLLRYHISPVGPYDELLIIPGTFAPPAELGNMSAYRITQIYVSSLSSVLNGRHNWNIPKHLARFEFIEVEDSPEKTLVRIYNLKSFRFTPNSSKKTWVFEPEFCDTAFFSVVIRRYLAKVNVPVNSRKLPLLDLTLIQPPLGPVPPPLSTKELLDCGSAGSTDWKKTRLELSGRCGLCSFEGTLGGWKGRFADDLFFPDVRPYRFGFHFPSVELKVFPATSLPVEKL